MDTFTRRDIMKKGIRLVMGATAGTLFHGMVSGCSDSKPSRAVIDIIVRETRRADIGPITLSVVYDNFCFKKPLKADWGFSCFVQGLDQVILFDAGQYPDVLLGNMVKLGLDPRLIDVVFISHDHPDHTGSIEKILEGRQGPDVFLPKSFPGGYKKTLRDMGARVIDIGMPGVVTKNCFSTGEMKSMMRNEHALVIRTNRGMIILTGCAHPGVVEIIERAKQLTNDEVLLVAGGFHLLEDYGTSLRKIASRFKGLGVRYVSPMHCSGGEARKIFSEVYGERYLEGGVGRVIAANDLTA